MLIESIVLLLAGSSQMDTSRIDGDRVVVEPVGISFELPPYWRDSVYRVAHKRQGCGAGSPGTVYTNPSRQRQELASARGEWDAEFSAVSDSVLSLRDLALHAGAQPWGRGNCFNDLQVRVYVVESTPSEVLSHVQSIGVPTADRRFKSSFAATDSGGWRIGRLSWNAFYYDYGSTARMDYYVQSVGGRSVVLLFMYADSWMRGNLDDKQAILASWR
jgi:hypothetical protein